MMPRLRDLDTFFGPASALSELSTLGQRPRQPRPGENGRKPRDTEALMNQVPVQRGDVASEEVARAMKVTERMIRPTEVEVRCYLEGQIAGGSGDVEGPLAEVDRAIRIADSPEVLGQVGEHPAFAQRIGKPFGKRFGSAKVLKDPGVLSEGVERISKVEAQIDSLFQRGIGLRQVGERGERLFEPRDGV